ncbi:ribonuclease HII [Candidatus Dojkabacteria bacterium]|uniref:Ribonuclease n=1 Tax=Candidatus Dojkabacteria bacterium TaxID=2099670 RepID=A0A3M0Z2G8_9BACT|nr:MAG: ribonuclease HII [Candidatus Dojkabacteria bacterium]
MFLSPTDEELKILELYDGVVGIDEVGRGCLAGPVVVCGFLFLKNDEVIPNVNDSKRLTKKQRLAVSERVSDERFVISIRDAQQIDQKGIANCIVECIYEINDCFHKNFWPKKFSFLIDGVFKHKFNFDYELVVKGDSKIYTIAVASNIAKVFRDKYMKELSKSFLNYGWDRNVGYGTKSHILSIRRFGLTVHHRLSFLKNVVDL